MFFGYIMNDFKHTLGYFIFFGGYLIVVILYSFTLDIYRE